MLENSIYSVISPEGCAAILWKDGEKGKEVAAESLKLTASDLCRLGVIDEIVKEHWGSSPRPARNGKNVETGHRATLERIGKNR